MEAEGVIDEDREALRQKDFGSDGASGKSDRMPTGKLFAIETFNCESPKDLRQTDRGMRLL
jgi:hypothetical protein